MTFRLRDFQPEDFDTLWKIDQQCFAPGIAYSRFELKVYLRRRRTSFSLIAELDSGSIAGFIVAETGRAGHIITIDVLPEARRLGIGSKLLEAAEARLCAAGSEGVALETAVDNASAIDLPDLSTVLNNFGLTNPNPSSEISNLNSPSTTSAPEPSSAILLGTSLLSAAIARRRRFFMHAFQIRSA